MFAVTLISMTTQVKALEVAINTVIPDISNKAKTFNVDTESKSILESLIVNPENELAGNNQDNFENSGKLPIFNLSEFINQRTQGEDINLGELGLNYLVDNPILNLNSLNIEEIVALFDKLSDPDTPTPLNLRSSSGEFIDFSNVDLEEFYGYLTSLKNPRAMGTNSPGVGTISRISIKSVKPNIENYLDSFSLASADDSSWASKYQTGNRDYNVNSLSYIDNDSYESFNYNGLEYSANRRIANSSVIGIGINHFNNFNAVYAASILAPTITVDTIERTRKFEINIDIKFSTAASAIPASAPLNISKINNVTSSSANAGASVDITFVTTTANITNNSSSFSISSGGLTLSGSNPGSPDNDFDVDATGMFIGLVKFKGNTHPFSLLSFDIDISADVGSRIGTLDSFRIVLNQATKKTKVHFENHTTGGETDTIVITGGSTGLFNFTSPLAFTTGDDIEFFASGPNQLRAVLLSEITINVPENSTYAKIFGLVVFLATLLIRRNEKNKQILR